MTTTAAASVDTMTQAENLARATKRLMPMYFRHGITDYLIAVFSMYEAMERAILAGLPVRVVAEPTSEDDLDVALRIVDGGDR